MRPILIFIFSIFFREVSAQSSNSQIFKIVEIPAKIVNDYPGIKVALNKQLLTASSKQAAFGILNDRLKTYKNLPVRIRQQVAVNNFNYFIYVIGAPKESQNSIVDIKGTRDLIDENIFLI